MIVPLPSTQVKHMKIATLCTPHILFLTKHISHRIAANILVIHSDTIFAMIQVWHKKVSTRFCHTQSILEFQPGSQAGLNFKMGHKVIL